MINEIDIPYFDPLFEKLEENDQELSESFGKHVHWGYWQQPKQALGTAADYSKAAEEFCLQLFKHGDIGENRQILDVGCGFGGTLSCLNDHYSNLNMIGVNITAVNFQEQRR